MPQLSPAAQGVVAREIGTMTGMHSSFTDVGAWSLIFPAGDVRDAAVGQAVGYAFHTDVKRGDRLLKTIAPSRERDAALEMAVFAIGRRDPAAAARRALEIGDAGKRQKSLDAVLAEWRERDPAAVEAWQRAQSR